MRCDFEKSLSLHSIRTILTLQSTAHHLFYDAVNRDIRSLLDMNRCKNKFEVARKKILASHFGDIDACVRTIFALMPVPTLPTALSWIGRDRREYSMMYHFLHSMSWPLDSTAISSMERLDLPTMYSYFALLRYEI